MSKMSEEDRQKLDDIFKKSRKGDFEEESTIDQELDEEQNEDQDKDKQD